MRRALHVPFGDGACPIGRLQERPAVPDDLIMFKPLLDRLLEDLC